MDTFEVYQVHGTRTRSGTDRRACSRLRQAQTVAFDLVHLKPSPFQGLSRVEMIVGIGSGESVTREFDVPPNGRPSLEVDFPLDDVTSFQLFGYGSGTDPLAHGAVSSIDGGPPLGA